MCVSLWLPSSPSFQLLLKAKLAAALCVRLLKSTMVSENKIKKIRLNFFNIKPVCLLAY